MKVTCPFTPFSLGEGEWEDSCCNQTKSSRCWAKGIRWGRGEVKNLSYWIYALLQASSPLWRQHSSLFSLISASKYRLKALHCPGQNYILYHRTCPEILPSVKWLTVRESTPMKDCQGLSFVKLSFLKSTCVGFRYVLRFELQLDQNKHKIWLNLKFRIYLLYYFLDISIKSVSISLYLPVKK